MRFQENEQFSRPWLLGWHRLAWTVPKESFRLERPILLFTSEELEHAIRRWKAAEQGWVSDVRNTSMGPGLNTRPVPNHLQRRIQMDHSLKAFHLVEGGRWLLVLRITGAVVYYDLDSPTGDMAGGIGPERQLIPDLAERRPWTVVLLAVDIDENEPFLTFNIAVYTRVWLGFISEQIQVWRVALQVDNQNKSAGLVANHLMTMSSLGLNSSPSAISICGNNIAWDRQTEHSCHIVVVDWTQPGTHAQSKSKPFKTFHTRRITHQGPGLRAFQLLPGSLFLLASGPTIKLYDLALLSVHYPESDALSNFAAALAHSILDTSGETPCIWQITVIDIFAGSLSKPFLCLRTNTVRFVLYTRLIVYGLIIPLIHSGDKASSDSHLVKLANYSLDSEPCGFTSGYHTAIVHTFKAETVILRYMWPEEYDIFSNGDGSKQGSVIRQYGEGAHTLQRTVAITCKNWDPFTPTMDEGSGRVVLSAQTGKELVVVDFSCLPRPTR